MWCSFLKSLSALQSDGNEETERKNEEELKKVFQTAVTLSFCRGLLAPQRARSLYGSGKLWVLCPLM